MNKAKEIFSTKNLTTLAVFVAVGYGLSWLEFPLFPAVEFLKLDFSNLITMLAGYMFGPLGVVIVEGLKQLLIFLTHSSTAGVGQLANFIMTAAFAIPPSLLYLFKKGKKWVLIGMAIGSVAQILVALLCNRYITFPLYMGAGAKAVFNSVWLYIVAFNAVKVVIISVLTFLIYKRFNRVLNRIFSPRKIVPTQKVQGTFNTSSESETANLAKRLAKTLKGGEIILLNGELGAGKTVFVRSMAEELKVEEGVVSPTFTLMNEYHGDKVNLVHIDAYRLTSGKEAYEAGLTEYFGKKDCICCIEWAENIADAFSGNSVTIEIKYTGENSREIKIK